MAASRLTEELASFRDVWPHGYYEGDVLDPVGASGYGEYGYVSVLYAVYVCCIKPHVHDGSSVLEIGPGRGAWTKAMLHAREVWCLDAKSRETNHIDEELGYPQNLVYRQVEDFTCRELPDDKFDFLFSFGALCHVSWEGIVQYANNLYPKLRHGATAFWMVGDYDKWNRLRAAAWRYDVVSRVLSGQRLRRARALDRTLARALGRPSPLLPGLPTSGRERLERLLGVRLLGRTRVPFKDKDETSTPRPGRWFHAGADRTAAMLSEAGYVVLSKDIGLVNRDPILHFRKP
jgi:hypothetical protein